METFLIKDHNTGENFSNFLIAQQNEQAAFIPKKFSYRNGFAAYISQFLQTFSLDDVKKYDLYFHKNTKYLFYCFNDYVKPMGAIDEKLDIHENLRIPSRCKKLKKKANNFW